MTGRDRLFVREKDPNYYYRWCNERDLVMLQRVDQGFEVVKGANDALPPELRDLQSTETPGGGDVRRRGDVILMRIRRDLYEENILRPKKEAAERQNATFDTMIQQADEQARRALRDHGVKGETLRRPLVFRDDSSEPIGG